MVVGSCADEERPVTASTRRGMGTIRHNLQGAAAVVLCPRVALDDGLPGIARVICATVPKKSSFSVITSQIEAARCPPTADVKWPARATEVLLVEDAS